MEGENMRDLMLCIVVVFFVAALFCFDQADCYAEDYDNTPGQTEYEEKMEKLFDRCGFALIVGAFASICWVAA
jgi:hypothetical protein